MKTDDLNKIVGINHLQSQQAYEAFAGVKKARGNYYLDVQGNFCCAGKVISKDCISIDFKVDQNLIIVKKFDANMNNGPGVLVFKKFYNSNETEEKPYKTLINLKLSQMISMGKNILFQNNFGQLSLLSVYDTQQERWKCHKIIQGQITSSIYQMGS